MRGHMLSTRLRAAESSVTRALSCAAATFCLPTPSPPSRARSAASVRPRALCSRRGLLALPRAAGDREIPTLHAALGVAPAAPRRDGRLHRSSRGTSARINSPVAGIAIVTHEKTLVSPALSLSSTLASAIVSSTVNARASLDRPMRHEGERETLVRPPPAFGSTCAPRRRTHRAVTPNPGLGAPLGLVRVDDIILGRRRRRPSVHPVPIGGQWVNGTAAR